MEASKPFKPRCTEEINTTNPRETNIAMECDGKVPMLKGKSCKSYYIMVYHRTKCAILLSYELAFTCRVTNSWLFKGVFWGGDLSSLAVLPVFHPCRRQGIWQEGQLRGSEVGESGDLRRKDVGVSRRRLYNPLFI